MKSIRKLLLTLGALAALAAPGVAAVPAYASGDNAALAINTTDGKTVYRIAIKITRNNTQVVTNTNIAFAYASCTDCQTVAIAFEGVIVTSDPTYFAPTNLAFVENFNCDGCTTYADATQVTFQSDGQAHFTALGNQILASIRHDLQSLRHDDLTFVQLIARVQADANTFTCLMVTDPGLVQQLGCVTWGQLVPAGNS